LVTKGRDARLEHALTQLEAAAKSIGNAASGSWIGYHANVYYTGFMSPEPGDHFSSEWGLMDTVSSSSASGWEELAPEAVRAAILNRGGNPDLSPHQAIAAQAKLLFAEKRDEVLSILESTERGRADSFVSRLREEAQSMKAFSVSNFVESQSPSRAMSRDSTAVSQGVWTPPHVEVMAEVFALRQPIGACEKLARLSKRAASHIRRIERQKTRTDRIGTSVFIGHGRSNVWRSLKDFVQDRLRLPWDEFNRLPVAGVTNISRLSEMLDGAAIAFLVMTAEDEQGDGTVRARENVVHEAGLFQGRLGFTRAILLIEEGCGEFSNINGLGQIRFPNGRIESAFEEVRKVLEREGLIEDLPHEAYRIKDSCRAPRRHNPGLD
jgi:predicted nucleotide-binding protein